jgi:DNA polymerase III subunit alpha
MMAGPMAEFVHLHTHTDFSLLDGASSSKVLIARAKELGMPGLAITDHGNLFGAVKFARECEAAGINPIIGSEFYTVGQGNRFEKTGTESGGKYYHLILWAVDSAGYKNIMKLSSLSYTEGFYYKPRIDDEILFSNSEGIACSTACIAGEIPTLILLGRAPDAEKRLLRFREAFGPDRFFLEVQDHGMREEKTVNSVLAGFSRKHGIPIIATNDIHYADKSDAYAHDILLCVGTNRKKDEPNRMRFPGPHFYMKSAEEMSSLFSEIPEAIANTLRVNEMCRVKIPKPGPLLPDYEIPQEFFGDDERLAGAETARVRAVADSFSDEMISKPHPAFRKKPTEEIAPEQRKRLAERLDSPVARYFVRSANAGLEHRFPAAGAEIRARLDYELAIILLMDFTGYFLIVADFINWAKDRGIPVGPGRGSGAGSLVAYSLRITDIDPLRYGLLFERFLNPERVSMPDFDVDFCYERRQEVIDYVTGKYGSDRVGQIITFGTLKAKAVLKDVARALDIPFDAANEIAKLVPEDPKMTLALAMEQEPKLAALAKEEKYKELFECAFKLEGKNRHSSYHAAGIVIGRTRLTDFVPLYKDPHMDTIATQFTMDVLEDCGLVKMDFLGLKTLTLIKNTIGLLAKRGVAIEEEKIPEDDARTYAMLSEGKATSVFQFESSGMQGILKQAKPGRMEDLIALNALYRPGPMAYIPQFIDSKWGRKPISYPEACLEPILKETYGVIVYQEQVMQVAQRIAGYSLGQADMLRRAMSKKKADVLAAERLPFVKGAEKSGFSAAKANEIYDILIPFSEYGFNKSHAAAYSIVAYRTAYLKANYAAEFMAANLTNEIANQDKLKEYIVETRSMGIAILPPDVSYSERNFTVVDGKIVYGLLGIKGLGGQAADEIVRAREEGGPFAGFMDFLDRVDLKAVNRKVIEVLVRTGCFDRLGMNRATLVTNLEPAADYAQHKKDGKKYGQTSLFGDCADEEFAEYVWIPADEYPRDERLDAEKELLGFYFSGHPLDDYRSAWERCADLDLANPERSSPDKTYTVIGLLKGFKEILTKSGKKMAFAGIDDFSGSIELVIFSDVLEKWRSSLRDGAVAAIRGKVDLSRGKPSLKVEELVDPSALREKAVREVHIRLHPAVAGSEDGLEALREAILEHSGTCRVFFHLDREKKEVVVEASKQIGVSAADRVFDELRRVPAVAEIWRE